jgi:hypothetical protein
MWQNTNQKCTYVVYGHHMSRYATCHQTISFLGFRVHKLLCHLLRLVEKPKCHSKVEGEKKVDMKPQVQAWDEENPIQPWKVSLFFNDKLHNSNSRCKIHNTQCRNICILLSFISQFKIHFFNSIPSVACELWVNWMNFERQYGIRFST